MSLDGSGAFRRYEVQTSQVGQRTDWFEQRLDAAVDSYVESRDLARYNLGFGLSNRDETGEPIAQDGFGYEYRNRIDLLDGGLTPVSVYADRQLWDLSSAQVPGQRRVSDIIGVEAGVRPRDLPNVDVFAHRFRHLFEEDDLLAWRTSVMGSRLVHHVGDLVVVGSLDRNTQLQPTRSRSLDTGRMVFSQKLPADLRLVGHVTSLQYATDNDTTDANLVPVKHGTQYANTQLNWQKDTKMLAAAYYNISQTAQPDMALGSWRSGGNFRYRPVPTLVTRIDVGGDGAWQRRTFERDAFHGSHGNVGALQQDDLLGGVYLLEGELGTAHLVDTDLGRGMQYAAQGRVGYTRALFSRFLTVGGHGSAGTQADRSPRDQDYDRVGAQAFLDTRSVYGMSLNGRLQHDAVDNRSTFVDRYATDSAPDTARTSARATLNEDITARLQLSYGFEGYRRVFDLTVTNGTTHFGRLRSVYHAQGTVGGGITHSTEYTDDLGMTRRLRVDGIATHRLGRVEVSARYSLQQEQGVLPNMREELIWLELTRNFLWDL